MIKKLTKDENAIKAIFDHFRNLGIVAVVFGAALWTFENPGTGWLAWSGRISCVCLTVLGFFLLVLNVRHGRHKLEEIGLSAWWEFFVTLIYGFSVFAIVISLFTRNR